MPATAPDVVRSAYAELIVTDLARSRWFWVDMLGLHVQFEDTDVACLRGTDELTHNTLVLRRGPVAALDHTAYRVRTQEDVTRAAEFCADLGRAAAAGAAGPWPGDLRGNGVTLSLADSLHGIVPLARSQGQPAGVTGCARFSG